MTQSISALKSTYDLSVKVHYEAMEALRAAVLEVTPYKVGYIVEGGCGQRAKITHVFCPSGCTTAYIIGLVLKADGTVGKREIRQGWSTGWLGEIKLVEG